MSSRGILAAYRSTFCLLILVAALRTLASEPEARHVVPLAGAEISGVLLLLWRRTQGLGLGLLLTVFGTAQLMAAHSGSWPTRFVQYAASALLIVLLDRSLGGAATTGAERAARAAGAGSA